MNQVLFLCTGNSCRSILAEALFNHLAPAGWQALSAGSHPTGEVHPAALALLAKKGISTSGYSSKAWDSLSVRPLMLVTVCDRAAGESCPLWLEKVALRAHWGVPDPAAIEPGSAQDAAFEHAFAVLHHRIAGFLQLPLQTLADAPQLFGTVVEQIGLLEPAQAADEPTTGHQPQP